MSKINSLTDMKDLLNALRPLTINKKITIYIIDDNIVSKKLLQTEITKLGYTNFNISLQSMDAFVMLKQKEEDAILIYPYSSKPLDGLQLIQGYLKTDKKIRMKICITLTENQFNLTDDLIRNGASATLCKPFEIKGIMKAFMQMKAI